MLPWIQDHPVSNTVEDFQDEINEEVIGKYLTKENCKVVSQVIISQ